MSTLVRLEYLAILLTVAALSLSACAPEANSHHVKVEACIKAALDDGTADPADIARRACEAQVTAAEQSGVRHE